MAVTSPDPKFPMTMTAQQAKSRRARNIAIGLMIFGLVILFYVITIVKLGSKVFTMFSGG